MKFRLILMAVMSIGFFAEAQSHYCYGVYSKNEWKPVCGEVPSPPPQFATPTTEVVFNQNDKLYLCSLVQLSKEQCSDVEFATGSGGLFGESGIIQFGITIYMKYQGKHCSGSIWKTHQKDNTWQLSSPTSILYFPSTCNIP